MKKVIIEDVLPWTFLLVLIGLGLYGLFWLGEYEPTTQRACSWQEREEGLVYICVDYPRRVEKLPDHPKEAR